MSDRIANNASSEVSPEPSVASALSLEAQGQMRSDTYRTTPIDRPLLIDSTEHLPALTIASQTESNPEPASDALRRENPDIARDGIHVSPSQESDRRRELRILAFAINRFDQMAGSEGTLNLRQLDNYINRRSSQGATEDEMFMLNKIAKRLSADGLTRNGVGLDKKGFTKAMSRWAR